MQVDIATANGVLVVALKGRLNMQTMPDVEKQVLEVLPGQKAVVFDMAGLEYIASCGLRLLVSTQKQLVRQGGTLILRNINEPIREILEITGLDDILAIE